MAFMKLNGLFNTAVIAMSNDRGLNEIMNLVKTEPKAIETLSLSEKTLLILFVSGLGMAVTFAVLLFLWFAISVLTKILNTGSKKPSKVEEIKTEVVTQASEEDDEVIIAVIAAAVAASMNTSIHNIIVKNVVRVNDQSPSWAKTGRIEQINTRF